MEPDEQCGEGKDGAWQESSWVPTQLSWATRPGFWGGAHPALRAVIGLRFKYIFTFSFIYLGVTHIPDMNMEIKGPLAVSSLLYYMGPGIPDHQVWHQVSFPTVSHGHGQEMVFSFN